MDWLGCIKMQSSCCVGTTGPSCRLTRDILLSDQSEGNLTLIDKFRCMSCCKLKHLLLSDMCPLTCCRCAAMPDSCAVLLHLLCMVLCG